MRRPCSLASPPSPDQTPPRRPKSRKPLTPRFLSFDENEENSQLSVLPHPTEFNSQIWDPHFWEPSSCFKKQKDKLLTNAFNATISARVNAVGLNNDLCNTRREENKENSSFISNSAVEELLMPYYRPLTPEPEDEPPLLLLDSAPDMFSTEPLYLELDEEVAYDYSMLSRWVSELTEYERNDNSYENDGPSTSARAIQLLLKLQDSVWMCRPNFVLPQKDPTKSVAKETTLQQLSDKSRQELEELKKLEELRQLEELRKLEELRELEELKQLGELEDIKELKELEPNAGVCLMNIMNLFRS